MEELQFIQLLCYWTLGMFGLAFLYLFLGNKRAPYGRYYQETPLLNGPMATIKLNAKLAWVLQELPSFAIPFYYSFVNPGVMFQYLPNKIILLMMIIHYFNRWVNKTQTDEMTLDQ